MFYMSEDDETVQRNHKALDSIHDETNYAMTLEKA
jgi:hypothetical protein